MDLSEGNSVLKHLVLDFNEQVNYEMECTGNSYKMATLMKKIIPLSHRQKWLNRLCVKKLTS